MFRDTELFSMNTDIKLDSSLSAYKDIEHMILVERLVGTEPVEHLYIFPTSDLLARVYQRPWYEYNSFIIPSKFQTDDGSLLFAAETLYTLFINQYISYSPAQGREGRN